MHRRKAVIQQILYLFVLKEELTFHLSLFERLAQILDLAACNVSVLVLHRAAHRAEEIVASLPSRRSIDTVRDNDGHRSQFQPTAVFRLIVLADFGKVLL